MGHYIEYLGNKLPDPAVLFLLLMLAVWAFSAWMSTMNFAELHPRSGEAIQIRNLLYGTSLT